MKLEEMIQTCFDEYPELYETRKQVLFRMYCYFGTGYKWENGELVSNESKLKKFKGKLGKDGKAIQKKKLKNVALKFFYNTYRERDIIKCSYKDFLKTMYLLEKELSTEGKQLETTILKDVIDTINLLRISNETHLMSAMHKKYSPIFNIPQNIKEDWAGGLKEVYEYLKELNINLDDIK